jgi:hypothetical protein
VSPDEERALQLELQARYDADAATVADIVRLEADAAKLEDDAAALRYQAAVLIQSLLDAGLFNAAETKLPSRYLKDGNKDSFDNVAHKPDYLIGKDELDAAVNLLNHLLPVMVD